MTSATVMKFPGHLRVPVWAEKKDLTNAWPMHGHDCGEIALVLGGKALHLTQAGEETLSRGHVIYVPPGGRHGFRKVEHLEHFNVQFKPADAQAFFPGFQKQLLNSFPQANGRQVQTSKMGETCFDDALHACTRMRHEIINGPPAEIPMLLVLLMELLIAIERGRTKSATPESASIRASIFRMAWRLGGDLTLEDLAAEAGLSTRHFCRRFRSETGETPWQYYLNLRLDRARTLIATRDEPLAAIAERCGFRQVSDFTARFRRRHGITPGAYRKSIQG